MIAATVSVQSWGVPVIPGVEVRMGDWGELQGRQVTTVDRVRADSSRWCARKWADSSDPRCDSASVWTLAAAIREQAHNGAALTAMGRVDEGDCASNRHLIWDTGWRVGATGRPARGEGREIREQSEGPRSEQHAR